MANTPMRAIRVNEELWAAAKERAAARGENLTEVIVRALGHYIEPHDCWDYSIAYTSDGPLGHGVECGKCGAFLQAG